jgi:hypothetical protein
MLPLGQTLLRIMIVRISLVVGATSTATPDPAVWLLLIRVSDATIDTTA